MLRVKREDVRLEAARAGVYRTVGANSHCSYLCPGWLG